MSRYDYIRESRQAFEEWSKGKWELLPITEFRGKRIAPLSALRFIDTPQTVEAIDLDVHPTAALFSDHFPDAAWRQRTHVCVAIPDEGQIQILMEDQAPVWAAVRSYLLTVTTATPEEQREASRQSIESAAAQIDLGC